MKNFTCFDENRASNIDDKSKISDKNVLEFSEVYKKNSKKIICLPTLKLKRLMEIYKVTMNTWQILLVLMRIMPQKLMTNGKISDTNVLEFSEVYKKKRRGEK